VGEFSIKPEATKLECSWRNGRGVNGRSEDRKDAGSLAARRKGSVLWGYGWSDSGQR